MDGNGLIPLDKKEEVKEKATEPVHLKRWQVWAMKISWVHAFFGILYYTGIGALIIELFF